MIHVYLILSHRSCIFKKATLVKKCIPKSTTFVLLQPENVKSNHTR